MSIFNYPNPTITKTTQAPLTNGVTVAQGDVVCGDPATGLLIAASAATATAVPVGFAARDYVGDGVTPIEVELFKPTYAYTFLNDATSNVAFAFTKCYVKDAQTVQALGTGKAGLGIALKRTATTVLVAVVAVGDDLVGTAEV